MIWQNLVKFKLFWQILDIDKTWTKVWQKMDKTLTFVQKIVQILSYPQFFGSTTTLCPALTNLPEGTISIRKGYNKAGPADSVTLTMETGQPLFILQGNSREGNEIFEHNCFISGGRDKVKQSYAFGSKFLAGGNSINVFSEARQFFSPTLLVN